GRGGRDAARPGGGRSGRGTSTATDRPPPRSCGTDHHRPTGPARNRRGLARGHLRHTPGGSLQEVPTLKKGQLAAYLGARDLRGAGNCASNHTRPALRRRGAPPSAHRRSDLPNPAANGIRNPNGGGAASASSTGRENDRPNNAPITKSSASA